eukprot:gene10658-11413_t
MPIEESGNMLIMLAGIHQARRSLAYLQPFSCMLGAWAGSVFAHHPVSDPAPAA